MDRRQIEGMGPGSFDDAFRPQGGSRHLLAQGQVPGAAYVDIHGKEPDIAGGFHIAHIPARLWCHSGGPAGLGPD